MFPFSFFWTNQREVVGYFRSVLLNTWAIGTFPFPGILIMGAGVFYCFHFHSTEHVGERNISVSWSVKNQGRGSWLFSFSSSEHVDVRNISVSWYLSHGAGVVYCFRFHCTEHVGERNISVSWYLNHKVRGSLLVSVSIPLNTWAKGTISVSWSLNHMGRGSLLFPFPFYWTRGR